MKTSAVHFILFVALFFAIFQAPLRAQDHPQDAPISDQAPALRSVQATHSTSSTTQTPTTQNSVGTTQNTQPEDAPLNDDAPALPSAQAPFAKSSTRMSNSSSAPPSATAANPGDSSQNAATGEDATPARGSLWNIAGSFSGADNGFMRQALLSGILVALLCSYVGIYIVLKRTVFVSVALAEMSSAGVALGLLFGFSPSWGAALFTLLGVVLFSFRLSPRRVPHESYIGLLYCVAGALGILLIARSAEGESQMLTLLQGNVLTGTAVETWQMAAAFALVALIHIAFHKEFTLVSFDRDQAATLGFNPTFWEFLLFLTIGVVIAFSVRAVGVLLTTALLIIPGMTALLWTSRLRQAWLVAALLAVLPVPLGLHFSLLSDSLPPSPLIVALSFLVLLPSLFFSALRKT